MCGEGDGCFDLQRGSESGAMATLESNEGYSGLVMKAAVLDGNLKLVQWIHANRPEGSLERMIETATSRGFDQIAEWVVRVYG